MSVLGGIMETMTQRLFTHGPHEHPSDCLDAVLHELAFEAGLRAR